MSIETKKGLEADPALRRYQDVRQLIASPANPTPLLKVKRIVPSGPFELYLKLEWYNPFGSTEDRPALYMLKALEERGELDAGKLVEPTSGNMGIALAALAAAEFANGEEGVAVAISPDSGLKYTSFFADVLGDEGKPKA